MEFDRSPRIGPEMDLMPTSVRHERPSSEGSCITANLSIPFNALTTLPALGKASTESKIIPRACYASQQAPQEILYASTRRNRMRQYGRGRYHQRNVNYGTNAPGPRHFTAASHDI